MYYTITTKYGQIKETDYTKAFYILQYAIKVLYNVLNGSGVVTVKTFINNFSDTSNEI